MSSNISRTPSSSDIKSYLRDKGVLVDQDVELDILIGRNISAKVGSSKSDSGVFYKQGGSRGESGNGGLLNEGFFHFWWQLTAGRVQRSPHGFANCILHDRPNDVLVFQLIDLDKYLDPTTLPPAELPPNAARRLADALCSVHRTYLELPPGADIPIGIENEAQHLSITHMTPQTYAQLDQGSRFALTFCQKSQPIKNLLAFQPTNVDEYTTITHQDLRLSNILVNPQDDDIKLIDWELARVGHFLDDPSHLAADLISLAISRTRITNTGSIDTSEFKSTLRSYMAWVGEIFSSLSLHLNIEIIHDKNLFTYVSAQIVRKLVATSMQRGRLQNQTSGTDLLTLRFAEGIAKSPSDSLQRMLTA